MKQEKENSIFLTLIFFLLCISFFFCLSKQGNRVIKDDFKAVDTAITAEGDYSFSEDAKAGESNEYRTASLIRAVSVRGRNFRYGNGISVIIYYLICVAWSLTSFDIVMRLCMPCYPSVQSLILRYIQKKDGKKSFYFIMSRI